MVEKFHEELKKLKKEVVEMGNLAKEMLSNAVEALKDRNKEVASQVIEKKKKIADMDERIEQDALRLIALYQPMARDMRKIACVLKMITYLTRVGRYGKDIAKVAIELADQPHIARLVEIPHMADMVCSMIEDALEAFENEDVSFIRDFEERDSEIDALRYSIFRECITYMMEDAKNITRCMHYAMVARYLERCADHACKMAEKINYMVTGERKEIR
ncbi:MAG: phosphate signaling complex protein PhoU [Thermoplasmata archaeon]|nr:phosphate signaling complex protein PhoU [Thermoplasmata archaeon]